MNPQLTPLIDQYLLGELSEAERLAFEVRLVADAQLQDDVNLQQQVYVAATRAVIRTEVLEAARRYHFLRRTVLAVILLLLVGLSAAALLLYASPTSARSASRASHFFPPYADMPMHSTLPSEQQRVVAQLARQSGVSAAAIEKLLNGLAADNPENAFPSTFFAWKGRDSVILTPQGVLLSLPANAFLLNGKPYTSSALIQWQEAIDPVTIMQSGLSTQAGDKLLETQGMFGFQAFTPSGKLLEVDPAVGVYVQVPVDQYKKDMQLFSGRLNAQGIIDWHSPRPLQKIPAPTTIDEKDFYPQESSDTLAQLKLREQQPTRDSLSTNRENADPQEGIPASEPTTPDRFKLPIPISTPRNPSGKIGTTPQLGKPRQETVPPVKTPARTTGRPMGGPMPDAALSNFAPAEPTDDKPSAEESSLPRLQFTGTNLATREFKRRLPAIHRTGDPAVLAIYLQNPTRSLAVSDALAARMGYPEFESFAAEQIGTVDANQPHVSNMQNFYESRRNARNASAQKNLMIRRQLAMSVGFMVTGTTRFHNIDKFVRLAKSMQGGSTPARTESARNFSLHVEEPNAYPQLYVYLLPTGVNSFQRISGTDGYFGAPLYEVPSALAIVGISPEGYFYYERMQMPGGDHGDVKLHPISESEFRARIAKLNASRSNRSRPVSQ